MSACTPRECGLVDAGPPATITADAYALRIRAKKSAASQETQETNITPA